MNQSQVVRLAVVQMTYPGTPAAAVDEAIDWIGKAADRGANVVCLQELFNGPYPAQSEDYAMFELAETIPGPTTDRLAREAKRLGIVLVVPLFERRAAGLYHNSAAVLDTDGSIAGVYRKMHIPDDPLFYEKFYFTPGDAKSAALPIVQNASPFVTGFQPIQTSLVRLGVGICWDQWYPEAARLFALAGAQILLYPTAIGYIAPDKQQHGAAMRDAWQTMMRSHSIANGVFLGAPNRVGVEDDLEFWGTSFISGPRGDVIAQAGTTESELLIADCDLSHIDAFRKHWPFLRDRRVDAYGDLTRRFIDSAAS